MRRSCAGILALGAAATSIAVLALVTDWERPHLLLTDFVVAVGTLLLVAATAINVLLTSRLVHSAHESYARPVKVSRTFGWQVDLRNYGPGIATDVRVYAWSSPFGRGASPWSTKSLRETASGPYEIPPGQEASFELSPFLDFSSASGGRSESAVLMVSWRLLTGKLIKVFWVLTRCPAYDLRPASLGQTWRSWLLYFARRARSTVLSWRGCGTMRRLPSNIQNVLLNTGDASREAALTLLVALGAYNSQDVEANWNNPLTRAEFVKDLVTALGRSATAQGSRSLRPTLTDEIPQWAWGFVNVGFYMGIVKSDKDGRFRPNDPVTYAEAITALIRAVPGHEALVQPGTWPYNYLFYAVDEDFTGGVDVGFANLPAARGDVASMIAASSTPRAGRCRAHRFWRIAPSGAS